CRCACPALRRTRWRSRSNTGGFRPSRRGYRPVPVSARDGRARRKFFAPCLVAQWLDGEPASNAKLRRPDAIRGRPGAVSGDTATDAVPPEEWAGPAAGLRPPTLSTGHWPIRPSSSPKGSPAPPSGAEQRPGRRPRRLTRSPRPDGPARRHASMPTCTRPTFYRRRHPLRRDRLR
ncbi:LOW QUALITY PROTEIN: aminoglycoside phosphotransferase, partial [Micromonospora sp. ATCC 39149]